MRRLIDTHAHLNFSEYDNDRGEVIANSLDRGVFMINVGVNYKSSLKAVGIAKQYESGVWAAIGLHPQNIGLNRAKDLLRLEDEREDSFDSAAYRELVQLSPNVIAIGEIGLDYQGLPKIEERASVIKREQAVIFKKQLVLARELGLPVIIHSRLAHPDLINILREEKDQSGIISGIVHCFTATVDQMREYRDLGLYFGLNGIIFKLDLNEAIKQMPLERILLETDCPFLLPPAASLVKGGPLLNIKRNEPRFAQDVAEKVAQIRNDSVETIIEAATANARKLFKI